MAGVKWLAHRLSIDVRRVRVLATADVTADTLSAPWRHASHVQGASNIEILRCAMCQTFGVVLLFCFVVEAASLSWGLNSLREKIRGCALPR